MKPYITLLWLLVAFSKLHSQSKITWKQLDGLATSIKEVTYLSTDDATVKMYYILPTKIKVNAKLPAVIWIHGGAWVGGKANTFFANAAYCALKGAVGFSLEYRVIDNNKASIYNCIADCKAAISYIKANASNLHIDPNKIAIVGESAGGHLAACMALLDTKNSTTPSALVLYNPVVNLATGKFIKYMNAEVALQTNNKPDTTALLFQYQNAAKAISPLYLIKKRLPPTLIINGMEDKITPYQFAVSFVDSLRKYHTKQKILLLPNVGHAFAVPHYKSSEKQVIEALLKADVFLSKLGFLKGKVELVNGNDANWYVRR
jgi:acetyl esterase/lipase